MVLNREDLEVEIKGHEANIIQYERMIGIFRIVIRALKLELQKYPKK